MLTKKDKERISQLLDSYRILLQDYKFATPSSGEKLQVELKSLIKKIGGCNCL